MSFFFGKKPKYKQVSTLSPGQQSLQNQITGGLTGGQAGQGYSAALQQLMDLVQGQPGAYNVMEAPARRQFQEQTVPNILERFTGAGAGRSSGLNRTLSSAATGLEENLAAQRGQMQQQAVQSLLNNFLSQSQLGLGTREFENVMEEGTPGFLQSLFSALQPGISGFAQAAGQGFGQQFGLNNLINMFYDYYF